MNNPSHCFDRVDESEREKASNSYLMSVIFITFALPLPIINLIATLVFSVANRKAPTFVKWHCTQALLSQFSLFVINTVAFIWTVLLLFQVFTLSNWYFGYLITIILFNLVEFIATVVAAIKTRKGVHHRWFFYGDLTDALIQPTPWERSF